MTKIDEALEAKARAWLERDPDQDTRAELQQLLQQGGASELEDRFAQRLSFGTAGLRGVLGAGPNRMNRLVVRETTTGLGKYLLQQIQDAAERGVVVGCDARHKSREMAQDTAATLAALGFRVFLFGDHAPTPVCAFAIRHLRAAGGVVVTASHNPPEYNGYKVYWDNGGQIIPPHDTGIAAAIDKAAAGPLLPCDLEEARHQGKVQLLGDEMLETYLFAIRGLSHAGAEDARRRMTIAYTPMHGVGAKVAERALAMAGFANVHTAASQRQPDPSFSTVSFPNPEEPGAMDAVLQLAEEKGADIALANDPDADRLAVAVRASNGSLRQLTGDQVGALLAAEQLRHAPPNAVVGTTIVSSRMLKTMAEAAGVSYFETLTGLKWIAEQSFQHEARGKVFVFGYEEALGYMVGGLVRDKDGITALVAFAELAARAKEAGTTVWKQLGDLYRAYGLYLTGLKTLRLSAGTKGPKPGDLLRRQPPDTIGNHPVEAIIDVEAGTRRAADGVTERIALPRSDVLVYELRGNARVVVRPSGTEPKLKCYYEVRGTLAPNESFEEAEQQTRQQLEQLIDEHQKQLAMLMSESAA